MILRRMTAVGTGALLVVSLFALLATAWAQEEKVELKLELPKPQFTGTQQEIKAANLEARNPKHPPVMVPKGLVNLALHKAVTSSDNEPIIGELEQVTDGDKEGVEGSYVELGSGVQWVQVDLGGLCEVFAVAVWHKHSLACVFHDVVIQCADDPDFVQNVKTLYSNDHDNSAGLGVGKSKAYIETNAGHLVDAKGVKTRYIRLYSNGNTTNVANDYTEVEVWGRPSS